jgi:hypothetical protein
MLNAYCRLLIELRRSNHKLAPYQVRASASCLDSSKLSAKTKPARRSREIETIQAKNLDVSSRADPKRLAAETNKTCARIIRSNVFVDLRGLPSTMSGDVPWRNNVGSRGTGDRKAEEFWVESRVARIFVSDPTSLTGCGNPYKLVGSHVTAVMPPPPEGSTAPSDTRRPRVRRRGHRRLPRRSATDRAACRRR